MEGETGEQKEVEETKTWQERRLVGVKYCVKEIFQLQDIVSGVWAKLP